MRNTYLQQYEKELVEGGEFKGMWRFISQLLETMSIEELSKKCHVPVNEIQQAIDYNSGK